MATANTHLLQKADQIIRIYNSSPSSHKQQGDPHVSAAPLNQRGWALTRVRRSPVRYLVLVLNERPQFAFALASRLLFGLSGVGQAVLRHRPLHGLTVVFELHVTWGLETRLVGLYHLIGVLEGEKV